MTRWKRAVHHGFWIVGALASVGGATAGAQPTLSSVTTMSLGSDLRPDGRYTETTSCNASNTYITRGTNPGTDAFLYSGNGIPGPCNSLIPSGISLNTGVNTFYLWGYTGLVGSPNYAVALFTGANVLTVSSYWSSSANTISGVGTTVYDDFGGYNPSLPGVGLSAILGDFRLTITDWSAAQVTRNVQVNSYDLFSTADSYVHNVGRLVLNVEDLRVPPTDPPVSTVPEPSTYVLMASGLAALGAISRRRKAVSK